MVKQSYDDPIKDKWRHAWFKFIKKNRGFLGGNPKNMTGVFFPGEDALELKVYDKLGIPRENLIGLEYDARSFEKLKRKKLGIRMTDEPMGALDFFKMTDEQFSFINLDYTCTFNWDVGNTLREISIRSKLKENSLLGITTYNKREGSKFKWLTDMINVKSQFSPEELKDAMAKRYDFDPNPYVKKQGKSRKDMKDYAITNWTTALFEDVFLEACDKLSEPLVDRLCEVFHKDKDNSGVLSKLVVRAKINPYFLKDVIRYEYVSRNAALMFSHFFRITKHTDVLKKYNYLAETPLEDITTMGIWNSLIGGNMREPSQIQKEFKKIINKDLKILGNPINSGSRIFLGSSARLPKLTGKEYYRKRYGDDENGISIEKTHNKLLQNFKVTRLQLPRFEAHYTMETYGKKYSVSRANAPDKDLENIVNINRNQIINGRDWGRLSENKKKRVEYFLGDDLSRLNLRQGELNQFADKLKDSKWVGNFNGNSSDLKLYAFFDDLMSNLLYDNNTQKKSVENIVRNFSNGTWKENGVKYVKPLLTRERYSELVCGGKTDVEILGDYRTNKPNSIRAYKAWITMEARKNTKAEGKSNVGHRATLVPREEKPGVYIDSRGVVHKSSKNIARIEKGYK